MKENEKVSSKRLAAQASDVLGEKSAHEFMKRFAGSVLSQTTKGKQTSCPIVRQSAHVLSPFRFKAKSMPTKSVQGKENQTLHFTGKLSSILPSVRFQTQNQHREPTKKFADVYGEPMKKLAGSFAGSLLSQARKPGCTKVQKNT
jgi:hypothetical protein